MKAIIFATSIKEGKHSNTRAWCDELNSTFKQNNISSEVITLKDYDYEASTPGGKDLLHEQMYKLYDADLIFFTSPINFSSLTFYLHNLLERFVHAQTKAVQKGLDIFANKRIEMLPVGGGHNRMHNAPLDTDWKEYEEKHYPGGVGNGYDIRHHKLVYKKLKFIKALGLMSLHIKSWNPIEPFGPDRNTMHGHPQTVHTIDRIMKKIETLGMHSQENKPKHTIEEFVECFRSDDEYAFGRGLTLAVENLNLKSVQEHIKLLYRKKCQIMTPSILYQLTVAMKERCVKAGLYEVADLYYFEQARQDAMALQLKKPYFNKSGRYRPNDY